jgi:membrane carboxypeptidase/penicillin-binding protein PbpC
MIQVFNHVAKSADSWFQRPVGVSQREVCAVTGDKRGKSCSHGQKKDYYLPGISSEHTCPVHRRIQVRVADAVEVCPYCMEGSPDQYQERIVEYWPKEVVTFLKKEGRNFMALPKHNPWCQHFYTRDRPRIISPALGSSYELDESLPEDIQKIPLKAFVAHDSDRIYWFLNSRLIHQGEAHDTCFLTPRRGTWTVSAVDSRGRSDSVTIKIY